MALKITLKPNERMIIGGAVLANGNSKECNLLIENNVPILREKDILSEKDADKLCSQIYFTIQLMYIDEKNLLLLKQETNGKLITRLLVKNKDGNHRFELNDQFLTQDVWGAYLTFENSSSQKPETLQEIEKVILSIVPARGAVDRESNTPGDKSIKGASGLLNDPDGTEYHFLPGKIEW